jgi:thioredoxin-related protein
MFSKPLYCTAAIARRVVGAALAVLVASGIAQAAELLPEPEMSDSGLHVQPWFVDSFLDLAEDLAEAGAEGKKLVIFIEQAGCPYCRELHEVNLRDPEIVAYLNEHFVSVQLDLRGSREVTDFDGEAMEERALTRKWGMIYTPTLVFFSPDKTGDGTKIGRDLAVSVMPGYFKPFHFRTMLEYVADGHYDTGKQFQDFINERATELRAKGEKVDIW